MYDMAKALKDIDDAVRRNAAVIELQEKILAAREAQGTLLDRVSTLEKEVTRFEAWEAEKQRYKLTDYGSGTFAYELKPATANGEPPHRICATCYQNGQKSILQFSHQSQGQDWFDCYGCSKRIALGTYVRTNRNVGPSEYF
jgi:hypothetical protein